MSDVYCAGEIEKEMSESLKSLAIRRLNDGDRFSQSLFTVSPPSSVLAGIVGVVVFNTT
jgi:hypothetical protein